MSVLNLLRAAFKVRRAESLSVERIKELQEQRLRKLLRHVFAHSTFYRRFYTEHGITEADLETIQPDDLPVIDKDIMMANYDDLVTDPALKQAEIEQFIHDSPQPGSLYRNKYAVVHTSGSSGTIGLFVYGPREWAVGKALSLRTTRVNMPFLRKKRIAFIAATDGRYATVSSFYNLPKYLFGLLPLSISASIEEIREQIDRFQPDVITGYASGLNLLAEEQCGGHIDISPSEAYCTGDPLTPAFRSRIETAFGVNPVNIYGSSETMAIAGECKAHHSMHLFEDWFSLQVVDKDLNQARAGKVVVTNLFNYTQPLIRYQMSDEIVLSDQPCPCGWPFPVIENIAGRSEEFLWFDKKDGGKDFIHPIVLAEFFVPGLEKFQFVQASAERLIMRVVVADTEQGDIEAAIRTRMKEILSGKALDESVRFDVEMVEAIANDPKTGKFRLVIPCSGK